MWVLLIQHLNKFTTIDREVHIWILQSNLYWTCCFEIIKNPHFKFNFDVYKLFKWFIHTIKEWHWELYRDGYNGRQCQYRTCPHFCKEWGSRPFTNPILFFGLGVRLDQYESTILKNLLRNLKCMWYVLVLNNYKHKYITSNFLVR